MTKSEQKIIKLLADYPEKEFYGQEIADKLKISKASVSGILKLLSQKGVVFREIKGHMKFYQINRRNPEFKKFRINLALEKVEPFLPKLKKFSQKVILFGSASRGEQTFDSDIDIFVLSYEKNSVRAIFKEIDAKLKIKAVIKTPSEWSEMEIKEPEFYQEVKNGITLYEYFPGI